MRSHRKNKSRVKTKAIIPCGSCNAGDKCMSIFGCGGSLDKVKDTIAEFAKFIKLPENVVARVFLQYAYDDFMTGRMDRERLIGIFEAYECFNKKIKVSDVTESGSSIH